MLGTAVETMVESRSSRNAANVMDVRTIGTWTRVRYCGPVAAGSCALSGELMVLAQ